MIKPLFKGFCCCSERHSSQIPVLSWCSALPLLTQLVLEDGSLTLTWYCGLLCGVCAASFHRLKISDCCECCFVHRGTVPLYKHILLAFVGWQNWYSFWFRVGKSSMCTICVLERFFLVWGGRVQHVHRGLYSMSAPGHFLPVMGLYITNNVCLKIIFINAKKIC